MTARHARNHFDLLTLPILGVSYGLILLLSSCASSAPGAKDVPPEVVSETAPTSEAAPTSEVTPDLVGQSLDDAVAAVESAGLRADYSDFSPDERSIWSRANWVVIDQKSSERSVKLTVKKAGELELITPSGLWAEKARSKCQTEIAGPDVEWRHEGLWSDARMVVESGDNWVQFAGPGLASVHNEVADEAQEFTFVCRVVRGEEQALQVADFSRSDR